MVYSDFDEDDLSLGELAKSLVYHPEAAVDAEEEPPAVESFVWFSENQQPRLGRVLSVDRTAPRPVQVQLYEPQATGEGIQRSRFRPVREEETGQMKVTRITLHQIMLKLEKLSARGYLLAADKRRLLKCLA